MKGKSINLVWIVVQDFKKAVKFYTEVMGLKLMEMHDEYPWAELQGEGGVRLGIGGCDEKGPIKPGDNAVITISVDDIQKAKDEMRKKGAKFIGEIHEVPGHVKMQLGSDLDGNHFQIVQELFKT